MIAAALLLSTLAGPNSWAGELLQEQKIFLQQFLGLSKKETDRKFVFEDLPESERAKYYGEVDRDKKNTILLNREKFHEHADDLGLREEGTIIHEAIHLFTYEKRGQEEDWAMEGVATLGEFLYDSQKFGKAAAFRSFLPIIKAYFESSQRSLTSFDQSPADYGKVFLFFLFLHQTFQGDEFTRAHFQTVATGLTGVTEALQTNKLFQLTPGAWKNHQVYVPHFYWSVINKHNSLATQANDYFDQLMLQVKATLTPQQAILDTEITLAPTSFQWFDLSNGPCKEGGVILKSKDITSLYALKPESGKFTKRFVDSTTLILAPEETSILLFNSEPDEVQYQLSCAH